MLAARCSSVEDRLPNASPNGSSPARRWLSLVLGLTVLGGLVTFDASPAAAGPPDHREQLRFMWAMAGQESGWDYYARNRSSGAFGKYQIMPFNWPAWAAKYIGDKQADQTPWNQEKVAYGKIHDLYRWLGSWKRVAYWWLTGRTDRNEKRWSSYAKGYVDNIMRLRRRAPAKGSAMPAKTSSKAARGDWRRSGSEQQLRLSVGGRTWPRGGGVRDGVVLKVRAAKTTPKGVRWLAVVTVDGRLGWLRQSQTVPARQPSRPGRWADVRTQGPRHARKDRVMVRPRPR